jgi:hypothetical protein
MPVLPVSLRVYIPGSMWLRRDTASCGFVIGTGDQRRIAIASLGNGRVLRALRGLPGMTRVPVEGENAEELTAPANTILQTRTAFSGAA